MKAPRDVFHEKYGCGSVSGEILKVRQKFFL